MENLRSSKINDLKYCLILLLVVFFLLFRRYLHLLAGEPTAEMLEETTPRPAVLPVGDRIGRLEEETRSLREELETLRREFEEFKGQF